MADEAPTARETDPLVSTTSAGNGGEEEGPKVSFMEDAMDTISLGIPIFFANLSFVGMKTTDSALLGHVSAQALAAAALSDLWTMTTAVLLQGRVLGVIISSAIGAGNTKLAGVYLQVSYTVISGLAIFVMLCWFMTERVWVWFGTDPETAEMAGLYAKILALSIPGQIIYGQLSQFFSAQRIMRPEVITASLALILNLVLGLIFVLGYPIPDFDGYGFPACPTVTSGVVYIQILVMWFLFIFIQRLHEPGWGGWSLQEITWERIGTFSKLYFPSALGMASDFWRVAVVGAVAARLGETEVAVFNTSYRIMWIVLILNGALAGAAGIKVSMRLGSLDHAGAKQAAEVGLSVCAVLLLAVGTAVMSNMRMLGRIFTNDPEFLDAFEKVAMPFTLTMILMNFAVAIEGIPNSMGRTTEVFRLGFCASWCAQVPAVILLTRYWRNDLVGLYCGMACGYGALVILYGWLALTSDWKHYAALARQRSEVSDEQK